MFQQLRNYCRKQPIKDSVRNYEKDILSSLLDVLPTYFSKLQKPAIQTEEPDKPEIQDVPYLSSPHTPEGRSQPRFSYQADMNQRARNSNDFVNETSKRNSLTTMQLKYNNLSKSTSLNDGNEENSNGLCKLSLDTLSLNNKFRQSCLTISQSGLYRFAMLLFTAIYIIVLLIKPYNGSDSGLGVNISEQVIAGLSYASIAVYMIQLIIQVVAYGAWYGKTAHFCNPFQLVNGVGLFFIVILQQYYLNIFQITQIVEYLVQFKLFAISLRISLTVKHTINIIVYVLLIIFYFMSVYAIVGLQVWNDTLGNYCLDSDGKVDQLPARLCGQFFGRECPTGYTCQSGGYFEQPFSQSYHNYTTFDSLQQSYITMFQAHQIEGYPYIEQQLSDAYSQEAATTFLWSYIILCTFFLQNLIVAVLLRRYREHEKPEAKVPSARPSRVQTEPRKTIFMNRQGIPKSKRRAMLLLQYTTIKEPSNRSQFKQLCKKIIDSKITKYFYNLLFLANLLVFSFNDEKAADTQLERNIAIANLSFLCIYLIEDALRLSLWKQKEHKFILILECLLDSISFIVQCYNLDKPFVLNSIKGLRLLWFFSTQDSWSNFRVLLSALYKSYDTLPSILLILCSFIIISAVLGREFFGGQLTFDMDGTYSSTGLLSTRINFDGLREAISSIFTIICSDQWVSVFYSTLKTHSFVPYPYFIGVLVICKFIIMPALLTIMLDNYEEAKLEADRSKASAEGIINRIKGKKKQGQVYPVLPNALQVPGQARKKYFGRTSQLTYESDSDDKPSQPPVLTAFHRAGSRVLSKDRNEESIIPFNWKEYVANSSYFLLHNKSLFRRKLTHMIQHKYYEQAVGGIILGNLVLLGFDNPLHDPIYTPLYRNLNIIFSSLFFVDFMLKSLSLGLFYNASDKSKAYMWNRWNIIDIVILILTSIHDFGVYDSEYLQAIKSLRLLRVLVSMRKGTQNEQLNLIASSLFQTISLLTSMLFVTGILIWILSICCMTLWKGQLSYCYDTATLSVVVDQASCIAEGGKWINHLANFDSIEDSLNSLFRLIIGEGWNELMYAVSDITGRGKQPIPNNSAENQYFFYILLFLLNIMLLNLFFGLIINNYRTIKENIENYKSLNDNQKEWLQMQQIMQRKKLITLVDIPVNEIRLYCYQISSYKYFEVIVIVLLLVNLIFCASYDRSYDQSTRNAFVGIYITFVVLFHIEMIIKLLAFWELFFKDILNKLDLILLIATDTILIVQNDLEVQQLYVIPLIFRCLHLINIRKFIKLNRHLKVLVDVILEVIPTLLSVVALILATTIVYALIGVQIFSRIQVTPTDPPYPFYTEEERSRVLIFTTFRDSFYILIRITTGQQWTLYLQEYVKQHEGCHYQTYEQMQSEGILGCGTYFSYFYFISFLILIRIIMLSLFLAMIIESYSDCRTENSAAISPYQIEDLLIKWSDYDPQGTGWLTAEDFACLTFELSPPLGFKDENQSYFDYNSAKQSSKAHIFNHRKKMILLKKDIFKNLKNFHVPIYANKKIHFKDVCIQLAHNAVCFKLRILAIEQIEDKVVLRKLRMSWESHYPDLTDFAIDKRNNQCLYAVDEFAISSITSILREVHEKKKAKARMLEYQVQKKIRQLAINEVSYFTKHSNDEPRHRRKSVTRKRIFPFAQQQKLKPSYDGDSMPNSGKRDRERKTVQWQKSPLKSSQRQNSLQTHNFYIDQQELYNGFPMKVVFETQKIDFPVEESLHRQQSSKSQILAAQQDTQLFNNSLPTSMRLRHGGISERNSDEEDSVLQGPYKIKLPDD